MRLFCSALLGLVALFVAACGDETNAAAPSASSPELSRERSKQLRLESIAARLEARLAKPYDPARLAAALAETKRLLASDKDAAEFDFGESNLLRPELEAFQGWNLPVQSGVTERTLLDFASPINPVHVVIQYGKLLEQHGIDLLVIPVPTRLDLYPERLPAITREEAYRGGNQGMLRFLLELNRHGVETVDLYEHFAEHLYSDAPDDDAELYFQREYHWTPRAVDLASDLIAEKIRELEGYTPGTLEAGTDFVLREQPGIWRIVSSKGEEEVEVHFRPVVTSEGERAFQRDRNNDILLLGDSFMVLFRDQNADQASQLFARLSRPLDLIAMSGGGPRRVWSSVARRNDELAGKRIVVWQFTSRALTSPTLKPVKIFKN